MNKFLSSYQNIIFWFSVFKMIKAGVFFDAE